MHAAPPLTPFLARPCLPQSFQASSLPFLDPPFPIPLINVPDLPFSFSYSFPYPSLPPDLLSHLSIAFFSHSCLPSLISLTFFPHRSVCSLLSIFPVVSLPLYVTFFHLSSFLLLSLSPLSDLSNSSTLSTSSFLPSVPSSFLLSFVYLLSPTGCLNSPFRSSDTAMRHKRVFQYPHQNIQIHTLTPLPEPHKALNSTA